MPPPATNKKQKRAKQPNPTPDSTATTQAKTQESHGSARETNQEARASKNRKKTGQATQAEARLSHSSSGQRPKNHGEQAGNEPGGKRERTRPAHGSESKRGGATSCNPGSCRAVAEKTGQRPPVGAPHGVRDDVCADERTDDQAAEGAWPGGLGVQQDPVPMR